MSRYTEINAICGLQSHVFKLIVYPIYVEFYPIIFNPYYWPLPVIRSIFTVPEMDIQGWISFKKKKKAPGGGGWLGIEGLFQNLNYSSKN